MLQVTQLPNSAFEARFKAAQFDAVITPADLRALAAKLVEANRLQDAAELIDEGLKEFPESEDLLVMHALLSEVQQDWPEASRTLEKLLAIQGTLAPVEVWRHWVRVLRCAGDAERAHQVTLTALQKAPGDPLLMSELTALQGQRAVKALKAAA